MEKSTRNRLYSLASTVITAISGLVAIPILNSEYGIEAVAVVGLYFLMQQWFAIIESVFNAEVTRVTTSFSSSIIDYEEWQLLLRGQQTLLILVSIIMASILAFVAESGYKLIELEQASEDTKLIFYCLSLSLVIRMFSGLERAIYRGLQKFKKLAIITSIFFLLRFPCAALFVSYFDFPLVAFAVLQFILVILELSVQKLSSPVGLSLEPRLPRLSSFAISNLFLSLLGVLSGQLDKLFVLGKATQEEFAIYSLGVQFAVGISLISRGFSNVALSEVAKAFDEGDQDRLSATLDASISSLAAILIPGTLFIIIFSSELMFFWLGDSHLANEAQVSTSLLCFAAALSAFNFYAYLTSNALRNFSVHIMFSISYTILYALALSVNMLEDKLLYASLVAVFFNLISLATYLPWNLRKIGYTHLGRTMNKSMTIVFRSAAIALALKSILYFVPNVSKMVDLVAFLLAVGVYLQFTYWQFSVLSHKK
ncbi:lipopolysaccharide biosynthesis protein [Gammaproteobacteria bacterium]|nr:lipopolysaccharide biosynthesis protein [Gammaproteobacteria bacterium]